jgi:anaerobic selenocysteine-containing dehydrogenase
MSARHTVHRVCPFCEATCGLAVEVEGDAIVGVRGDRDDPFSRGYICPKAYGLKELYHDPETTHPSAHSAHRKRCRSTSKSADGARKGPPR